MIWQHWVSGAVVALAAALGVDALQPPASAALPAPRRVVVSATPEPLSRADPGLAAIGDLEYLGGVQLRGSDPSFGGISALRTGPGDSFLGVTDTGNWISFRTTETADRLTGVTDVQMAAIPGLDGKPAASKAEGDAESLEWNPATGTAEVGYEQRQRVIHLAGPPLAMRPVRDEAMTPMMAWPANGGAETLVRLPGGERLIVAEDVEREAGRHYGMFTKGNATRPVSIAGLPGFKPTDAVALDATRVLMLHRRFTPFDQAAAVTLVDLAPILAGGDRAEARILAEWRPPLLVDNMEGLAIRRTGNRTFLYIVSDDNFSSLQRTLLLKFELMASDGAPSP